MSILAIGDVHGMVNKFEELWELAAPSKDDTVIMLGDYVDRGKDSKKVITSILKKKREGYNLINLMGNHEHMLIHYLLKQNIDLEDGDDPVHYNIFLLNGGTATINSYGGNMPKTHLKFFADLLPYYETDEYVFVHAGIRPHIPMINQLFGDIFWIREAFINRKPDIGKTIVFGHTPTMGINGCGTNPYFGDEKIGIDTGCVFGGKLTGMWLPSRDYIQV